VATVRIYKYQSLNAASVFGVHILRTFMTMHYYL